MIDKIIKELERLAKENLGYNNSNMTESEMRTYCSLSLFEVEEIVKKYENDGWVSVKDRLPTETKYYNVTLNNSYVEFLYYNTFAETWYFMADGKEENNTNWEEKCNNVTAWRELPQPYKGE